MLAITWNSSFLMRRLHFLPVTGPAPRADATDTTRFVRLELSAIGMAKRCWLAMWI
jgi:hypothetical protein